MKLKMKSDHDWGNVFWNGPNGEMLCQRKAAKVIDIDEKVKAIYIMTAPKVPVRAKDDAFDLHSGTRVIRDAGTRNLSRHLKIWLCDANKSGDRYAWIEY